MQSSLARVYQAVLTGAGYRVRVAHTGDEATAACQEVQPDVALLDLRQGGHGGLDLMRRCLRGAPGTRFILVAANGSVGRVVEAMRAGAHDYIVSPVDERRLLSVVATAMQSPPSMLPLHGSVGYCPELVGESSAMQQVHDRIEAISRAPLRVLICGETGTGKDLCGRVIHARSTPPGAPFAALDCRTTGPDDLAAALRGTAAEDGASDGSHDGMGTLYLDEITAIGPEAAEVLRAHLHGADAARSPRLIASSTSNPAQAVQQGRLSPELYYRLAETTLDLPPLRARDDDVVRIANHALTEGALAGINGVGGLQDDAAEALLRHDWPGNVRELLNLLRNIALRFGPKPISAAMLPPAMTGTHATPSLPADMLLGRTMSEIEQAVIEATIAREGGSVPRAAAVLGLSPSTLYRKRENWTGRTASPR